MWASFPEERADKASSSAEKVLRPEIQPDMYGGEPVSVVMRWKRVLPDPLCHPL